MAKPKRSEKNANVFYLSLSAVQKCVRRGNADLAVKFARLAWKEDSWGLFRRLWTILFEDCSRDLDTLFAFHQFRGSYKDFDAFEPLIRKMAAAKKSHDAVGISWTIIKKIELPDESSGLDVGLRAALASLQEAWHDDTYHFYDEWYEDETRWVVDLAERGKKMDFERLGIGIPFIHCPKFKEMWGLELVIDEVEGPSTMIHDTIPAEAIDTHTRPGKFLLELLWKAVQSRALKVGLREPDLGMLFFMNEGGLLKNRAAYPFDFWQHCARQRTWIKGNGKEAVAWFHEEALPKMNDLRTWTFNGKFKDLLEDIKKG